ncbi:MAG: helix-turn-helix domain-containing protein, partial [Thermodesulfobacteriota bacterium]|nr:helix-turn-helix domain-containing protein [Thermodesulfobacteriota bacterium]
CKFYGIKRDDEIPQTRELAPETERIIKLVSDFYNVAEEDLYISKRGFFNEPRNVAIYLVRKLRRDTLTQICKDFSTNKTVL